MTPSRLDRLLAPWVFVTVGILFNVLSAVITHYFIGLNNDEISALDRRINDKQVLIDSLWQAKTEVDRKQEFFVLLLTGHPEDSELVDRFYEDFVARLIDTYRLAGFEEELADRDGAELDLVLDVSQAAQQSIIASINDTYFEMLELQEARMPLERANARLTSIAIFLQVTGLILVLARDLRRH